LIARVSLRAVTVGYRRNAAARPKARTAHPHRLLKPDAHLALRLNFIIAACGGNRGCFTLFALRFHYRTEEKGLIERFATWHPRLHAAVRTLPSVRCDELTPPAQTQAIQTGSSIFGPESERFAEVSPETLRRDYGVTMPHQMIESHQRGLLRDQTDERRPEFRCRISFMASIPELLNDT